jgi:hypothetical protein
MHVLTTARSPHRYEEIDYKKEAANGERFARDIEALYDRMWERAVAGLPPEHLSAA